MVIMVQIESLLPWARIQVSWKNYAKIQPRKYNSIMNEVPRYSPHHMNFEHRHHSKHIAPQPATVKMQQERIVWIRFHWNLRTLAHTLQNTHARDGGYGPKRPMKILYIYVLYTFRRAEIHELSLLLCVREPSIIISNFHTHRALSSLPIFGHRQSNMWPTPHDQMCIFVVPVPNRDSFFRWIFGRAFFEY